MKLAVLLFLSISLIPSAIAEQQYQEKIFVYSLDLSSGMPAGEDCTAGVNKIAARYNIHDINPTFASRFKIYSVDTWDRTGKVTNIAVQEIGDILVCQDHQTNPPEMNLVPIYYEITIGGRTYSGEGAGTSTNFPELSALPGGGVTHSPPDYPSPGAAYFQNFTGTVLPSRPGTVGGTFLESALITNRENEHGLRSHVIQVLHILVPINEPE